jgi:hypothetical protein
VSSAITLRRGRRIALSAAAAALGSIAVAAPGANAAVTTSANDPATGFPHAYTDGNGLSLALCVDGPPLCINTPRPDPATAPSVPENFAPDGEAFWFQAHADVAAGSGGTAGLVVGQEATFDTADGAPAAGHQVSFGRIRVKASGLVANATYTITHPYGVDTVKANGAGAIFTTEDTGCLAAPCAFGSAPAGRMAAFLQWAPNIANAADKPPTGYIGDAATPHKVIGSPADTNYFQITGPNAGGPGVNSVRTDLFVVQGKYAGPPPPPAPHPVLNTRSLSFPDRQVGAAGAAQTVVVTNRGTAPAAFGAATFGGVDPADFRVVTDTCSGATVAAGDSCSMDVAFVATATGARSASLVLTGNSTRSPHVVTLSATGTPGPVPAPIIVLPAPAPAAARPAAQAAPAAAGSRAASVAAAASVSGPRAAAVSTSTALRIGKARRSGVKVQFTVPAGARLAQVQLLRGKRVAASAVMLGAGRKTVTFKRGLSTGRYTIAIRVGTRLSSLGPVVKRAVTILR